jgi:hypothetical protein
LPERGRNPGDRWRWAGACERSQIQPEGHDLVAVSGLKATPVEGKAGPPFECRSRRSTGTRGAIGDIGEQSTSEIGKLRFPVTPALYAGRVDGETAEGY